MSLAELSVENIEDDLPVPIMMELEDPNQMLTLMELEPPTINLQVPIQQQQPQNQFHQWPQPQRQHQPQQQLMQPYQPLPHQFYQHQHHYQHQLLQPQWTKIDEDVKNNNILYQNRGSTPSMPSSASSSSNPFLSNSTPLLKVQPQYQPTLTQKQQQKQKQLQPLPSPQQTTQAKMSTPQQPRQHQKQLIPCTEIKSPRSELTQIPQHAFDSAVHLHFLNLNRNTISYIPKQIQFFTSLVELNLGRNEITELPNEFAAMTSLVRLDLSSNRLRKLPVGFSNLKSLQQLQLNGNALTEWPEDIFELPLLLKLYLGANHIRVLPEQIKRLKNLQVLYVGGNLLTSLPVEVSDLTNLEVLYLGDNQLSVLPDRFCELASLRTLNLHNNKFEYLPAKLVKMASLQNLSLRGNPLVTKFIHDEESFKQPLTLMELAARAVKIHGIPYHNNKRVPTEIKHFLDGARRCNNPSCAGVYFQTAVKNLQVVDFCGKFRVPLIKFLCKTQCNTQPSYPQCSKLENNTTKCAKRMKRILLDNYQGSTCDCIACTASNTK